MRRTLIGTALLLSMVVAEGPARATSIAIGGIVVDDQGQFSPVAGATTVDFNAVPLGNQGFAAGPAAYVANIFSCPCSGDGDVRDDTTRAARALVGTPLTIDFSQPISSFGLYWGSPDRGNTLTLFDGATQMLSFTGTQLNGLGVGFGTPSAAYVTFTAGPGERYTRIVLSSTDFPFETDNHAFTTPVPEPTVLLLFALSGVGMIPRARRLGRQRAGHMS